MADSAFSDDDLLLERIAQGDHSAFTALVIRHSGRFYRLAYRFTLNSEAAEDIVQDAFMKLWERPHMYDSGRASSFVPWFYRIIVNRSINHQKKKKPYLLLEQEEIVDERPGQDDLLEMTQDQRALEREILLLPTRQQTALNLCYYEGLNRIEAAEIMGVSVKALESLLARAKTRIKERLADTD